MIKCEPGTRKPPPLVAWERVKHRSNLRNSLPVDYYRVLRNTLPDCIDDGNDFKSEWWVATGLIYWNNAMARQLGEMAGFPCDKLAEMNSKTHQLKALLQMGRMSQPEFDSKYILLTGQPPPRGDEFDGFVNGLTFLGGEHIPVEMESTIGRPFVPSPTWLEW